MPSIIVMTNEGNTIHKEVFDPTDAFFDQLMKNGKFPELSQIRSNAKINSLIIITEIVPESKPLAPNLSGRQINILQLLSKGYSPDQIALKLNLSMPTIRLHMTKLKEKFGTSSRDQMMAMAGQLGLCNPYEDMGAD
jgi:DNA-binding NarL/FixJ family response regulator